MTKNQHQFIHYLARTSKVQAAVTLYLRELKLFAKEARRITGSPMAKHMRTATKSHAEYWTRKSYPLFRATDPGRAHE